jgi:hypothetical protein
MSKFSIGTEIELKNISDVPRETIEKQSFKKELEERKLLIQELIERYKDIYPPSNRVLIAVDLKYKDRVSLGESGVILERPRNYDDLNHRVTQTSQGWVINSDYLESGSEVLVSHNSFHETNKLFTFDNEISLQSIGVFSIPKTECYVYRVNNGKWKACEGFLLGLKVFEPYNGILEGIEPKEIKRTFFVTTDGYLKHKVVDTVNAAILPIIANDENYNEIIINRIRHYPNDPYNVREEVLAINNEKTNKVLKGELLIGNNNKDCQKYDYKRLKENN